ncbi:MAG: hypothetical protein FJ211_09260 [Ignavibacteria bacterium]|nr:hypothetical protein [Ignavibacteria bacterium]
MFLLDGKPLSPDVAFTDVHGILRPANFLRLATPEEREAAGVTEVPDPPTWDQRFAWGYSEDGTLIWKDHAQLVEQWCDQTRTTAGTLLQPTDWMVIREADNGVVMSQAVKDRRQEIRLLSGQKIAAIQATTTTEELAAYVTGPDYSQWEPQPEPPLVDTIEFSGGVTGAAIIG